MKRIFPLLPFGVVAILLLKLSGGCTHETENLTDFESICFTRDVLPVFQNSCGISGCHDAATHEEGYVFTDYTSILAGVTPRDPDKSAAYRVIASPLVLAMPPDHALPEAARIRIRLWIEQGARETSCDSDSVGGGGSLDYPVCFERDLLPVFRSSCALEQCHDAITAEEGIRMTDFASIMNKRELVVPGNPSKSELYEAITEDPQSEDIMPPRPHQPLSPAIIDSIYNWILAGARNDDCPSLCDTIRPVSYNEQLKPLIGSNCIGCHGAENPSSGIALADYASLKAAAESNLLIPAVNRTGPVPMPPAYALSSCQQLIFSLWKEDGYIESKGGMQ